MGVHASCDWYFFKCQNFRMYTSILMCDVWSFDAAGDSSCVCKCSSYASQLLLRLHVVLNEGKSCLCEL